VYGHRNNVNGYTENLNMVDKELGKIIEKLKEEDILIITADHGCDPSTESTDHSRECVPLLVYGKKINAINLGVRESFSDVAKTICEVFKVDNQLSGNSFFREIVK
jgi:phosphopentomutase